MKLDTRFFGGPPLGIALASSALPAAGTELLVEAGASTAGSTSAPSGGGNAGESDSDGLPAEETGLLAWCALRPARSRRRGR